MDGFPLLTSSVMRCVIPACGAATLGRMRTAVVLRPQTTESFCPTGSSLVIQKAGDLAATA